MAATKTAYKKATRRLVTLSGKGPRSQPLKPKKCTAVSTAAWKRAAKRTVSRI
jgi:hypothetical protein